MHACALQAALRVATTDTGLCCFFLSCPYHRATLCTSPHRAHCTPAAPIAVAHSSCLKFAFRIGVQVPGPASTVNATDSAHKSSSVCAPSCQRFLNAVLVHELMDTQVRACSCIGSCVLKHANAYRLMHAHANSCMLMHALTLKQGPTLP